MCGTCRTTPIYSQRARASSVGKTPSFSFSQVDLYAVWIVQQIPPTQSSYEMMLHQSRIEWWIGRHDDCKTQKAQLVIGLHINPTGTVGQEIMPEEMMVSSQEDKDIVETLV